MNSRLHKESYAEAVLYVKDFCLCAVIVINYSAVSEYAVNIKKKEFDPF